MVLAVLACTAPSSSYAAGFEFTALLRPGLVQIHVNDAENTKAPRNGEVIMCVHGLAHTAATFDPLTHTIFTDPGLGKKVRHVITFDMPARDGSSAPFGPRAPKFGDLGIDDYASITIQALAQCEIRGLQVDAIVAHSMGGLVVQVAQEKLLSNHLSLRWTFGVKGLVTMGTSEPSQIFDPVLESGFDLYLLSIYATADPILGEVLAVDPYSFQAFFFTDLNGNVVTGAPTPDQIVALGYEADEAYQASLETVGTSDMRPSVRTGAFSPCYGTSLRVVFGSQDGFSDPGAQKSVYEYLTGDLSDKNLVEDPAADSAHDKFISNPVGELKLLGL